MNLIDEYAASAHVAAVRAHAESGYRRGRRRRGRPWRPQPAGESRHRPAPPSG